MLITPTFKKQSPFRKRAEYSNKEDTEILKFVLEKRLHRKVGGNRAWQTVSKLKENCRKLLKISSIVNYNVFVGRLSLIIRINRYKIDSGGPFCLT